MMKASLGAQLEQEEEAKEMDAASEDGGEYVFVGHGRCEDQDRKPYEHWESTYMESLYFVDNDASNCFCKDCEALCNRYSTCIGYEYYCCPSGVRCMGSASLLFSRGTRPRVPPPGGFSDRGPYDSATTGSEYPGKGPIGGVFSFIWDQQNGGYNCFSNKKGY